MAFVVLFSTMSFTVDMHFCGTALVDFSFAKPAATCGMEIADAKTSCDKPILSEKSCCSNKSVVKQGNDDLKLSIEKCSLQQLPFIANFAPAYKNLFVAAPACEKPFIEYDPPFVERDVRVLHQSFLI